MTAQAKVRGTVLRRRLKVGLYVGESGADVPAHVGGAFPRGQAGELRVGTACGMPQQDGTERPPANQALQSIHEQRDFVAVRLIGAIHLPDVVEAEYVSCSRRFSTASLRAAVRCTLLTTRRAL
jgi:hypothetical protein